MRASDPRRLARLILPLCLAAALAACGKGAEKSHDGHGHGPEVAADEAERGPHGGRLLRDGDFALEITLYEDGPEPLFRLYAYRKDKPVAPRDVQASIALTRLGGAVDRFTLAPEADYLTSPAPIAEPHSFDVSVAATEGGRRHTWTYATYEGRTTIAADAARAGGLSTERAGPGLLAETLPLQGRIEIKPEGQSEVHARYPGKVMVMSVELGQRVRKGQVVARVESSESLQTYAVTAPISGVVMRKTVTVGAITGNEPMLVIADPTLLHAEFFLYPRDAERVRVGQKVEVVSLAGDHRILSTIEAVLPTADLTNQTLIAHVHLDNPGEAWRPGLGVKGTVQVGAATAPVTVQTKAIQPFRDFDVVYAKVGDTYEVRMLKLGRRTADRTEVLGGLAAGTEYVVDGAFLIRADIEKSGASHDH